MKSKLCLCCKKTEIPNERSRKYCKNCSKHINDRISQKIGGITGGLKSLIDTLDAGEKQ